MFNSFNFDGFEKNKTTRIYLWDEFIRFYLCYIAPNKKIIVQNVFKENLFKSITESSIDTYYGLAFEKFCIKNIPIILKYLNISLQEVKNFGPFFKQAPRKIPQTKQTTGNGLQIDLIIELHSKTILVFECKFKTNPVSSVIIADFNKKLEFLSTPSKYSIEKYLITSSKVTKELSHSRFFQKIINAEELINEANIS